LHVLKCRINQRIFMVLRYWKYGAAVLAVGLWSLGLVDQLESFELTARYVVLSLAIVAVATI